MEGWTVGGVDVHRRPIDEVNPARYLPDSFGYRPEKSLDSSFRTPMRNLFGRGIAEFGAILNQVQNDVPEILDFSGHRLIIGENCPVISVGICSPLKEGRKRTFPRVQGRERPSIFPAGTD